MQVPKRPVSKKGNIKERKIYQIDIQFLFVFCWWLPCSYDSDICLVYVNWRKSEYSLCGVVVPLVSPILPLRLTRLLQLKYMINYPHCYPSTSTGLERDRDRAWRVEEIISKHLHLDRNVKVIENLHDFVSLCSLNLFSIGQLTPIFHNAHS
jgi:hypothetical protein